MIKNYLGNRPLICGRKSTDSNFQHPSIISIANEPPEELNDHDRFIVGPEILTNVYYHNKKFGNATPNQIATYFADVKQFIFENPYIGMEVINTSENKLLKYNGTEWEVELDFLPPEYDLPLQMTYGGTSANNSYDAVENIGAAHNLVIFQRKTDLKVGYVIPLFKLDNTQENTNSFCSGNLIFKSIDTASTLEESVSEDMFYNLSLSAMKKYNEETAVWNLSVLGDNPDHFEIVTFTYGGSKWFGVKFTTEDYSFNIGYFTGIGSDLRNLDLLAYYNFDTKEIINAEIMSELTVLNVSDTSKPIKYVSEIKGQITGPVTGKVDITNMPTQGLDDNKVLTASKDSEGNYSLKWGIGLRGKLDLENFPTAGADENALLSIEQTEESELKLKWTDKINIANLPDNPEEKKVLMVVKNTDNELTLGWGDGGGIGPSGKIDLSHLPDEGRAENKLLGLKLVNDQLVLAWIDATYAE